MKITDYGDNCPRWSCYIFEWPAIACINCPIHQSYSALPNNQKSHYRSCLCWVSHTSIHDLTVRSNERKARCWTESEKVLASIWWKFAVWHQMYGLVSRNSCRLPAYIIGCSLFGRRRTSLRGSTIDHTALRVTRLWKSNTKGQEFTMADRIFVLKNK